MIKFINNNDVSIFINVLLFYANKEFHFRMSFIFDIIDYVIIRKRFDAIKAKDIINHMQDVFIYIRENLNKAQLVIIK